jgi:hypothetical protein
VCVRERGADGWATVALRVGVKRAGEAGSLVRPLRNKNFGYVFPNNTKSNINSKEIARSL